MLQDEHSMLVQEWILNEYIAHKYDIIGRLSTGVRLSRNGCHPIIHDNVTVGLCPNKIRFNVSLHCFG